VATGGSDVNLGIDIDKKGSGDKEAAAGLELVAKAADDAADELKQLDRKLIETRVAMVAAGRDFAKTGDISPFKALLKDQRELTTVSKTLNKFSDDSAKAAERAAARMKKAFEDALSDKKGGIFGFFSGGSLSNALIPQMQSSGLQAGEVFANGFRSTLVSLAGPIGLVVGPPLVAAIGASIAGATLTGLGLAAIAGGIALQFKSPAVHDAATDLGSFVKQQLTEATEGFGPRFVAGLTALRREAEPLWAELRTGIQSLDPYVANILTRLGEGLAKMGPGLQHALQAAGPVLGALAKNIPTLLNAVGMFFDQISKGGKGATLAIDAITKTVATLIVQLGVALRVASDVFNGMAQAGDKVTGILAGIFNALAKIPGVGPLIQGVAAAFSSLHGYVHGVAVSFDEAGLSATGATGAMSSGAGAAAQSIYGTGNAVQALNQKLSDLLGQALSVKQSELGMAQALTGVADSAKQQGTSLDTATAAGQANASALLAGAQAAARHRETLLAAGASADFATAAYNRDIDSLFKAADAAHFNAGQVNGLIGNLRAVPGDTNANVRVTGVDSATEKVIGLSRALNSLHDRIVTTTLIQNTITGQVTESVHAGPRLNALGGINLFGARGLIAGAPSIIVGERTVPEAAIPAPNSGISQNRADMLLGTAASWWGRRLVPAGGGGGSAGPTVLELTSDGGSASDLVLELLRSAVKVRGGNVQIIVAGKPAA
jgi:hypothetical protein